MKDNFFYKVAVAAPLKPLTYKSQNGDLRRGQSVLLPLGKRRAKGVILERLNAPEENLNIKSIYDINSERPLLPAPFLSWCEALSTYYLYPLGLILSSCFPPLKKKALQTSAPSLFKESSLCLTKEQQVCLKGIQNLDGFSVHLIHGVTGSGKTEIYLQFLERLQRLQKTALILVPEISLTPQMMDRFSHKFPGQVAVLHSGLTPRTRTNEWWSLRDKKKSILIGARSSLFCPLEDVGAIIVDEEHDSSFKQEEKFRYHGRDAAVMLGQFHNCPVLLGSATPSLESWNNVLKKKYTKHTLKQRVENRPQADIHVISLKEASVKEKQRQHQLPYWLSHELYEELRHNLERKKQSALFLNKRGMASVALCGACGFSFKCPNCDVSLTPHGKKYLNCHYCGYGDTLKELCPECKEPEVKLMGLGTEKIVEDLKLIFKDARLQRVDRDKIKSYKDMRSFIKDMEDHKVDILVGTQMISKGLDFPKLTLIGFILADIEMNWPDFRTNERAFQSFTQVAGRSGRHERGRVVVQTYNPDNQSLNFFKAHDLEGFMKWELHHREEKHYPPCAKLLLCRIQGLSSNKVRETANELKKRAGLLKEKFSAYTDLEILGPTPSSLFRLKNQYRYNLLLKDKSQNTPVLRAFMEQITEDESWITSGTKIFYDRDPYTII